MSGTKKIYFCSALSIFSITLQRIGKIPMRFFVKHSSIASKAPFWKQTSYKLHA